MKIKKLLLYLIIFGLCIAFLNGCGERKEKYFQQYSSANLKYATVSMEFTEELENMIILKSLNEDVLENIIKKQEKAHDKIKKVKPYKDIKELHNELLELYSLEINIEKKILREVKNGETLILEEIDELIENNRDINKVKTIIADIFYTEIDAN